MLHSNRDKYSGSPVGSSNTLKNECLRMMHGCQNKREIEFFKIVKTVVKNQNMIEVIHGHSTVLLALMNYGIDRLRHAPMPVRITYNLINLPPFAQVNDREDECLLHE